MKKKIFWTKSDRKQFMDYVRFVKRIESPVHQAEKAVEYAREDAEINDLYFHLRTI